MAKEIILGTPPQFTIPAGGTSDQLLAKNDDSDYNLYWKTANQSFTALTDVPTTFAPSAHNHDELYYTKGEINTSLNSYVLTNTLKTINGQPLTGGGNMVISGSITDGDKGDISVTSSGAVWTIDNGAVTDDKISAVSVTKLSGVVDKTNLPPVNFSQTDFVGDGQTQQTALKINPSILDGVKNHAGQSFTIRSLSQTEYDNIIRDDNTIYIIV